MSGVCWCLLIYVEQKSWHDFEALGQVMHDLDLRVS